MLVTKFSGAAQGLFFILLTKLRQFRREAGDQQSCTKKALQASFRFFAAADWAGAAAWVRAQKYQNLKHMLRLCSRTASDGCQCWSLPFCGEGPCEIWLSAVQDTFLHSDLEPIEVSVITSMSFPVLITPQSVFERKNPAVEYQVALIKIQQKKRI